MNRSDAVILLAVGIFRHYAWGVAPDDLAGMASKGLAAGAILYLLLRLYDPQYWPIYAWWGWEEAQVVICSAWYMAWPWTVPAGEAMCSAKIGFPIGAVGIVIAAFLLARYYQPLQVTKARK